MRKLNAALASALGLALAIGTNAVADADTLPTTADSQDFATSVGGWTSATTYAGLCIPAVTCAAVTNSFQAADGAAGASDGHVRAGFSSLLTTVAGTSTSTWSSPDFVYDGAGGMTPKKVLFNLSLRPDISALLGVDLLNTSSYRVDLVDESDVVVSVVPTTQLTAATTWSAIPSKAVNPALLTIGSTYHLQITTTFTSVAALLASGSVGYDDVSLTTVSMNGGSGITTPGQLATLIPTTVLPGSASYAKGKVKVRVRCPKVAAPLSCTITAQGLSKGRTSKPGTRAKTVTVVPGRGKVVALRVKAGSRARYAKATTIWLRANVKVGSVKAKGTRKVTLRH